MKKIPVVLLLTMLLSICLFGEENNNGKSSVPLYKPLETSDIWLDINRLSGVFRNNGIWDFDVVANTQGTEWPKGSGNSPIFAGGQWISASVNGEKKVAAIIHSASEYQAGMVLSPGVGDNPKDPKYKWYELRSSGTDDRDRWPLEQGAPVDASGDPLLLGDQTIFSVWNDLGDHAEFGTNKLSVEVQQTAWAYNRADALGDMHFIKWRMVNKSGEAWDSTYFSIWLDPDLGDASDDLVGCDTTLGLGFTYNATNADQTYGTPPPAQGIDFFQGPIVDEVGSVVTLPDGTVLQDKTMLKMTSFIFYDNNDSNQGNPQDANDVWNYQTGFWRDDSPITFGLRGAEPVSTDHPSTSFMFSGDPETEQGGLGWLDYNADDRRFLMTTGPFTMPAWVDDNGNGIPDFGETGVQDIVAGVILAKGDDNLNSVTKLKEVDGLAQLAYDLNFNLSKAPLPPVVTTSTMSNEVVLTWDETSEFNDDGSPYSSTDPIVAAAYNDTVIIDNVVQVINDSTYNFYGYSVYQYSDASGADPVLLEHWDNGGLNDATPYTSQRFVKMTVNKNSAVGNSGAPLVNGKEYYFGIVAEGYLAFGAPKVFTSPAAIVSVVPMANPGTSYSAQYGDSLTVTHERVDTNIPLSDGSVVAWVVDPSATTGRSYKVVFSEDSLGNPLWDLLDASSGDTILAKQSNQAGDDAYNVVEGLLIKVQGPAAGIKSVTQVDPADWTIELDNNVNLSLGHQFNSTDPRYFVSAQGADDAAGSLARWDWRGHMTPNDYIIEFVNNPTTDGQICLSAWANAVDPTTNTWFVRGWVEADTAGGVKTYHDTGGRLPFKVWKKTTDGTLTQVTAGILDGGEEWYWDTHRSTPFTDSSGFDRIYVCDYPYDEAELLADGGDNVLNGIYWGSLWDSGHSLGRVVFSMYTYNAGPFQGAIAAKPPAPGTVVYYKTNKPNLTNDFYTFTAPSAKLVTNASLAADMKKIKVVPNPYYGYHSGELDPFNRWVQFTYLPPTCTVRIFDLAGNLIRKLEKDDETTPFLQWDMKNEYELPVASGIYVFHVDAPGIGEKIGKIAIFTPNERLDTY